MKATSQTITPVMAEKYLKSNTGNFRNLDPKRINLFAESIRNGDWHANGESIKFGDNGILLDGQHRLAAIVESGLPVEMLVVREIECDALHIDRGRPRTISQWISHLGIPNAKHVASAARYCCIHNIERWAKRHQSVQDSDVVDYIEAHWENLYINSAYVPGIPRSLVSAILFLGSGETDPRKNTMAMWFHEKLISGENLSEGEPVLQLRNMLTIRNSKIEMTRFSQRMLMTIAWNRTVTGDIGRRLIMRMTGPNKSILPDKVLVATND